MKKRFCHECGMDAALDATFCEECGAELRPLPAAQAALPPRSAPSPTPSPLKGRTLALAGGAVALLVVAGGAAWFALAPKGATESELRAGADAWVKTAALAQRNRPCLQNFDYRANPVLVNPTDSATQEWMAVLVKARIYVEPTEVQTGYAWQPIKLSYQKGPEASQYLLNGQLCAASQIQVSHVSFDAKAEAKLGETRVQPGTVGLAWQDRAPWSLEEPVKSAFDSRFEAREEKLLWLRDKDGWRVSSDSESNRLQREAAKLVQRTSPSASALQAGGFSLASFFSGLFSFGDTPEKAVERFFRSLESGKPQEAAELLYSGEIPKEKLGVMLAASSAEIVKRGGISRIENEDLGGGDNTRRLRNKITFNDGRTETKVVPLRKVDGRWRLDMSQ